VSQEDDLKIQYQSASNEQPSKQTDQLILQAAADAVKSETTTANNVIKGRFSFRRWQTPVSIAAAAVITVSFVSSMDPWSDAEFEQPASELTISKEEEKQQLSEMESEAQRYRVNTAQKEKTKQSDNRVKKIKADTQKQLTQISTTGKPVLNKSITAAKEEADEQRATLGSVQPRTADMMESTFTEEVANTPGVKQTATMPEPTKSRDEKKSITSSLDTIEEKLIAGDSELARLELEMLLNQNPLHKFSEVELERLEAIQRKFKTLSTSE